MPARSRAPLMARPPRSEPDRDLRPPSRRPIGVRAPATMTDWDMKRSLQEIYSTLLRGNVTGALVCDGSPRGPSTSLCPNLGGMSSSDLVPDHLFIAIDHVGIAVPDLDDALE